ncbi:MAG: hypothetical protein ACXWE9_10540 [Methylobacter sp.]
MFKVNLSVILIVAGMSFQNVYADDASSALQKTQDCLRNQNCEAATTEIGKDADQKALEAVGGNAHDKQELYNISADIMPLLLQQTGGDPEKMQAIMLKAQTDPESFLNSLSPEIRTKIKNASIEIEKKRASGQKP